MGMNRYVFTAAPGAEIRIGTYGLATNATPAVVPDTIADELDGQPHLVVSLEPTRPPSAGAGEQKPRASKAGAKDKEK